MVISIVGGLYLARNYAAPANFPANSQITIEPGSTVRDIVEQFEANDYVASSNLLYLTLVFLHDATDIRAGTYSFTNPVPVTEVASVITKIGPKDELVRVTIPEGSTVKQIAAIAAEKLDNFKPTSFISYAETDEGFLFPETYFLPEEFTDAEFYDLLRSTYEEQISPLRSQIEFHPLNEYDIIVLASLLEREANSPDSMKLVSSVLQNRLAIDMPLQADASIEYILDKPLSKLTPEDLKIDSLYNTYLYRGLTPTPIGNPGRDAIKAVLEPTPSEYFYYITDPDGVFHFAETYTEHTANIARYLR